MESIISIGLCAMGALIFTATPLRADDGKNAIKGGMSIGPVRLKTDIMEAGKNLDGTTTELYSSRKSGVSVMIERPPGTPASDKPAPGVPPSGKCRALIVQAVDENANFVQLGVGSK